MECLPDTGTNIATPIGVAAGLMLVGIMALVAARRGRGGAAAAVVLLAVLVAIVGQSPPAQADGAEPPCPPGYRAVWVGPSTTTSPATAPRSTSPTSPPTIPRSTSPAARPTSPLTRPVPPPSSTAAPTPPSPTATTSSTTTPSTTTASRLGAVRGRIILDGESFELNDAPGRYETQPGNVDFGPADPNAPWNLPTILPLTGPGDGLTVTLTGPGPDGVGGTPDDVRSVTEAGSDGQYSFSDVPAGTYTIVVSTPENPELPVEPWGFRGEGGLPCFARITSYGDRPQDSQVWLADPRSQTAVVSAGAEVEVSPVVLRNDVATLVLTCT